MSSQTHRIHRHNYEDHFTVFSNRLWEDEYISWGAKALLAYMLSRPRNWVVYRGQLASIYKGEKRGNGKDAVDSYFTELINSGYIVYTPQDQKTGKFIHRYDVYPEPTEDFQKKNPKAVKPSTGFTEQGLNHPQTRNDPLPSNEEGNNNPDGLGSPSAVVVPSWDEELNKLNLTDPQKWKIHNEHPDKVKLLVKRVLAWNGRPDDIIAVNTILRDWDDWHDNLTLDERMEKNKIWLQKFKKYETDRSMSTGGQVSVTVLSKSIEVSTVTQAMSVSIDEKQFVNKVKEMFEKFGLKFEY